MARAARPPRLPRRRQDRVGRKPGAGGYRRTSLVATFAAAFPMDKPRYVVIAMLDEPQGTAATSGQRTAAWNAAPIVGRVVPRIGPLLGVCPMPAAMSIFPTCRRWSPMEKANEAGHHRARSGLRAA
jgi:hypothetical protein